MNQGDADRGARGERGARRELEALGELAALYGVASAFTGAEGTVHRAEPDVILALLRALGVPVQQAADAPSALRARRLADARRVLEPVLVRRSGRPASCTATLPERIDPEQAWVTVVLEDGTTSTERLQPALRGPSVDRQLEGQRFARYRVDLDHLTPRPLPPGYHSVTVEAAGIPGQARVSATALLISAPPCPEATRGWGVFMPLYALRTEDDWGTGSYRDLADLGRWVGQLGGAMVGGLPLYPTFLDRPVDPSPYRPVSRLAYNELYVDPVALPELAQSEEARRLLHSDDFRQRIAAAHKSSLVEYEEVARLRRQVTEPMAEALLAGGSARLDELVAFGRARPELAAYAHFRASLDRLGRDRVADVAPPLAGGGSLEPTFGYHLYGQWTACQQLQQAGAALPLYADLPVGVHPDGFDPWWSPGSFVPAVHGGAPPDLFFGGGQDWGFPPLHPEGIRQDGYRHLIAVLRRALRHAAYLRVDHVMGLQRLYMIPAGGDARHGAYVSYRAEELHALVSLEAHRAGTVVVGEDLGTVPAEVRRRMAADRMLRSWVFQFESTATEPLPAVPPAVLASMGTHDLPRFGAYLWGTDIDEREEAGVLSAAAAAGQRANRDLARRRLLRALDVPEVPDGPGVPGDGVPGAETTAAALRGCLSHLAQSAADLVLVDLEELWGERHPQNHPGTGPEAGNWRRRGARTLAEARGDPALTDVLDQVDRLRRRVAP